MNEPIAWIRQGEYGKPIIVQNPLHQFSYQAESAKWDDVPLYTHPAKPLSNVVVASATCSCGKVMEVTNLQEAKTLTDDSTRYQWLRNEFANGRETYLAEGMPSGEELDRYIDEQLKKASEK